MAIGREVEREIEVSILNYKKMDGILRIENII